MRQQFTIQRVLINLAVIVGIVASIAIASHFLLRCGTRHNASTTVPEFRGLGLHAAEGIASEQGFQFEVTDSLYVPIAEGGEVLEQNPAPGVEVKPGRKIYVVINAFGKKMVDIPYVAGLSLRQAINTLDVSGLKIDKIKYVSDMATNYVLSSTHKGKPIKKDSDYQAVAGDGVTLTVGVNRTDNPKTITPNLIGLSIKDALSRIWESGLNVGNVNVEEDVDLIRDKDARVFLQGVPANNEVEWGSTLSVRLTKDKKKIQEAVSY